MKHDRTAHPNANPFWSIEQNQVFIDAHLKVDIAKKIRVSVYYLLKSFSGKCWNSYVWYGSFELRNSDSTREKTRDTMLLQCSADGFKYYGYFSSVFTAARCELLYFVYSIFCERYFWLAQAFAGSRRTNEFRIEWYVNVKRTCM